MVRGGENLLCILYAADEKMQVGELVEGCSESRSDSVGGEDGCEMRFLGFIYYHRSVLAFWLLLLRSENRFSN